MGGRACTRQCFAREQPARARLDRDVNLLVSEPTDPVAHGCGRGANPAAVDLACFLVQGVESDLRFVHVEPSYDRHRGSPL